MRFNELAAWLSWLESCHPTEIELGLGRVASVAQDLQLDFSRTRVVTVAGTNGKGSCVAAINHLLLNAGVRVGCYTSPHLLAYNERICINGELVDDASLMAAFARIDKARGDTSLTYFEFGTLAALDLFSRQSLDVIVLEVGLGGRLDAVNIIDADIAVITAVDLDHQDWLGDSRERIGSEKAGIMRAGRYCIYADESPVATVLAQAQALACPLLLLNRDFGWQCDNDAAASSWYGRNHCAETITVQGITLPDLPLPSLAAAVQVLELLHYRADYRQLQSLQVMGRFQTLRYQGKTLIVDVAHNPAAVALLAQRLRERPIAGKTLALTAIMADKAVSQMISIIEPVIDNWYIGDLPGNRRAMPASVLAALLTEQGCTPRVQADTVVGALAQALDAMTVDDRLLVFGSFFTVAAVMMALAPDGHCTAAVTEVNVEKQP